MGYPVSCALQGVPENFTYKITSVDMESARMMKTGIKPVNSRYMNKSYTIRVIVVVVRL